LYYLAAAGIWGFCSMTAMLFFKFKPEEKSDDQFIEKVSSRN
jgi:hypothetical protein